MSTFQMKTTEVTNEKWALENGWLPLYAAPVQPVKQEPVAWTNYNGAVNNRLKGAPVDAKAIRAEALEEAAKVCDAIANAEWDAYKGRTEPIDRSKLYNAHTEGISDGADECAAAIRNLK